MVSFLNSIDFNFTMILPVRISHTTKGGAWGTGKPWMYRLCASPFLEAGLAVAIVGYRTYPDGFVQDQVDDLESAAKAIATKYSHLARKPNGQNDEDWLGLTLMGHSSGAHIAMIMAVERIERCVINNQDYYDADTLYFNNLIGLSGVYNISHHFDYEACRGVEELSPMKPACGFTRESFDHLSPAIRLRRLLHKKVQKGNIDEIVNKLMPNTLLVHGCHDSTVPFFSTSEAASILRSCGVEVCQEYYMICGHPDVVIELMLGGKTRKIVLDWLQDTTVRSLSKNVRVDKLSSKL
jgi:acetyl esterase/lipase